MTARVTSDPGEAARVLRDGGLVAFPTETVYGLGADALNAQAVARVFEVKGRPAFDPLIVHVARRDQIGRVASGFPAIAARLAERFWPGPLTLVVPKTPAVPDLVTAGLPTVGVRIPDHSLALEMLADAGCPVAAPSANLFGRTSPTTAGHVLEQLGDRIDLILDGGPCRVGLESTVLQLTETQPSVLRFGGVPIESLEQVIGPVRIAADDAEEAAPHASPGRLTQHYAPACEMLLVEDWSRAPSGPEVGVLAFSSPPLNEHYAAVEVLSQTGDLREAAANLFAAMRRLDKSGARLVVCELAPERDLGRAINDRLRRAAARPSSSDFPGGPP